MNRKSYFTMPSLCSRKRLLLVAGAPAEATRRCEFLRRNGYEVHCAPSSDTAVSMSRLNSYDLVLLAIENDSPELPALGNRIEKENPNARVAYLADCGKSIPPMPCDRMLWKGEPLEYFLARLEALAATA